MTISINLDDLTQEHVDRCAPHIGGCSYSAPCIIGTLIDDDLADCDQIGIDHLLAERAISAPLAQWEEIIALQFAFDSSDASMLSLILAQRGLKWPGQ